MCELKTKNYFLSNSKKLLNILRNQKNFFLCMYKMGSLALFIANAQRKILMDFDEYEEFGRVQKYMVNQLKNR